MRKDLLDLSKWSVENDWNEHFYFMIEPNVAYEIFVEYHTSNTPIENAEASLCVTSKWEYDENLTTIRRSWLGEHLSIKELLEIVQDDYMGE